MNRKILALLWLAMVISGCTKYTDEQYFTAIRNGDARTVQAIISQRDMTNIKDGNAYEFDKATFKTRIVPINQMPSKDAFGNGFSGLWIAVEDNKPEIVEILLQQNFDLAEEHKVDDTTLTLGEIVGAENSCNPSIIKIFAQKGVAFNNVGLKNGSPVIVTAASAGKWDCVDALIEAGADPKAADSRGMGLLTQAVFQYEKINIDNLIQKMKDFDPFSFDANLAFIHAARSGNAGLVKNFLNRGFNKCHSHKGKYLRDIALEENHVTTAELLPTKEQCEKIK